MKKLINKFTLLSLLIGLAFSIGLLFTSCDNFLTADEVKKEIEEAIEIANSEKINYYIIADNDSGSVIPGNISARKNDVFDIRFVPSNEYQLIKWEVINKVTGQVENDIIHFDDPESLETKARILKPGKNYYIHPKCIQIPAIVSARPEKSNISYANTPIVITFNVPMENQSVSQDTSLFKYGEQYISIKHGNNEISEYFETPFFNEDKTVLTIMPKYSGDDDDPKQFYKYIGNSLLIEITVSFGSSIVYNLEGKTYQINQNPGKKLSFSYSGYTESTSPEKDIFFASRLEYPIDSFTQIPQEDRFITDNIIEPYYTNNTITAEKFWHNRTNGSFNVYGQYRDSDSGVNSVKISSFKLEFDPDIQTYSQIKSKEETYYVSDKSIFITNDSITKFRIPFSVADDVLQEPLSIEVTVYDAVGNPAETEKIFVIVKNYLDIKGIYVSNITWNDFYEGGNSVEFLYDDNTNEFDYDYYDENLKKIRVYNIEEEPESYIEENSKDMITYKCNGGNIIDLDYFPECYTIECEYLNDNNKITRKAFSEYEVVDSDSGIGNWEFTFENVASVKDFSFKVIVTDDLGNTDETIVTYPSEVSILEINQNKTGDTVTDSTFTFQPPYYSNQRWKTGFVKDDYSQVILTDDNYKATIADGEYYIIPANEKMFGQFSTDKYSISTELSTIASIPEESVQINYTSSKNSGKIDITVTLDEDLWNYYSNIYFLHHFMNHQVQTSNGWEWVESPQEIKIFEKGQTELTFEEFFTTMFDHETKIEIHGVRNNYVSSGLTCAISKITDYSFDNELPSISINKGSNNNCDIIPIQVKDSYSGIKSINIYRDEELFFSGDNYNGIKSVELSISKWDIIDSSSEKIKVVARDCNDNEKTEYLSKIPITTGVFYPYQKNESNFTLRTKPLTYIGKPDWKYLFYIYQFTAPQNSTEKKWSFYATTPKTVMTKIEDNINPQLGTYEYNLGITSLSDRFIKIIYEEITSYPVFCYTGRQNSGEYDFILKNGNSNDSFIISSDAPVLITTYVSQKSYDEIKNRTVLEWGLYSQHIGEKQMDFDESSRPKVYTVPSDIPDGSYYVVVAYFADGTSRMTEVMQK